MQINMLVFAFDGARYFATRAMVIHSMFIFRWNAHRKIHFFVYIRITRDGCADTNGVNLSPIEKYFLVSIDRSE